MPTLPIRSWMSVLTMLSPLAACSGDYKTDDADTGGIATGGDSGLEVCEHEYFSPFGFDGPVVSWCIEYNAPDFGSTAEVAVYYSTVPALSPLVIQRVDPLSVWATWLEQDMGGGVLQTRVGRYDLAPSHITTTFWHGFYPTATHTCGDYTQLGDGFVHTDINMLYYGVGDVDCLSAMPVPPPPPVQVSGSEDGVCRPGTATFDLKVIQAMEASPDGTRPVRLTPISRTKNPFPERAWLRSLTVTEMGTFGGFRVAAEGGVLDYGEGGTVTGGTLIDAKTTYSFGAGDTRMNAMLGAQGVDLTDPELVMPDVSLTWSCEVDEKGPHWAPLPSHEPVVGDFSELGLQHELVFWVDTIHGTLRIAPRGRLVDARPFRLSPEGTFKGALLGYDATFSGTLVEDPKGGGYTLTDGIVTVAELEVLVSTTVLTSPTK